jgi:hypothetical protein
MHGVAHDQRRLGRIDDDDGLALLRAADLLDRARRGAREFVDVLARAGADGWTTRWRRFRRSFTFCTRDTAATIGIVAWPPQVTMLTFISPLPTCSTRLTGGTQYGPMAAGVRSIIITPSAFSLRAVLGMDVGRGRVEGDLDAVFLDVRHRPSMPSLVVLSPSSRLRAQAVGGGVDADHPHRFEHLAALEPCRADRCRCCRNRSARI